MMLHLKEERPMFKVEKKNHRCWGEERSEHIRFIFYRYHLFLLWSISLRAEAVSSRDGYIMGVWKKFTCWPICRNQ